LLCSFIIERVYKYNRDISIMQENNRDFSIIKKRILQYLDNKGISKYESYQKTGITNGVFSQSNGMSEENLLRFLSYYKNVDKDWLFDGIGNMEKTDKPQSLEKSIPNYNLADTNYRYEEIDTIRIPIMDISAAAGLTGYINDAHNSTLDHLSLPAHMIRSGTNVAVRVRGESMSPTLFDSDNLVIRLLDPGEWLEMTNEHVYVVVDKENKVYLKRVKNRFENGFIVCMSDNVDKFNFPNFNLQSNEIISIWHAEWRFSAKMPNINDTYFNRIRQLEDRFDELINTLKKPV